MKTVSIIRDRGQLTIPDAVRKQASWAQPMSAVSISVEPNKIIIEPVHSQKSWDEIWQGIQKARAIKGSGKAISASEFLEQDRRSH